MSTRVAKRQSVMRKEPKQARSRVTVEAIVEAGARILAEEGWAGFTTNRIADVAGVSIGSLYQYFPDKLALVDAIRHRHLNDSMEVMRRVRADGISPEQFATQLVAAVVAIHSIHPGLHRVLLDEAPTFKNIGTLIATLSVNISPTTPRRSPRFESARRTRPIMLRVV